MNRDSSPTTDSWPGKSGQRSVATKAARLGLSGFSFEFSSKNPRDTKLPDNAFYWLAALVLFAQLPHLFHLPWWVSICGVLLVVLWIAIRRHPNVRVLSLLRDSHALAFVACC